MALVQALLPVSAEPHNPGFTGPARRRRQSGPSPPPTTNLDPMGSVGSLISSRPGLYHDPRAGVEPGTRAHWPAPAAARLDSPQDPLLRGVPPPKNQSSALSGRGEGGDYSYLKDYVGEWNDQHVAPGSPAAEAGETKEGPGVKVGGPPPKLIPVSGKLEKNMENAVLRPTAFKPVVPKSRSSMHYLSPRHCANVTESQTGVNSLSPAHRDSSPSCSERRSSYSGGRNGGGQSCSLSDSGRNSLSSLPPYNGAGYCPAPGEAGPGHVEPTKSGALAGAHGHSNSDSGRSSSSKSTGSSGGRGQPLSDSGSGGRSPGPVEGYEGVVRDLEDKLRERELELQQLRDNLDENEAAICQVYEEKQKRFELELEELRQGCATRMQSASQKAQRAQQVLQLQVYQLQQEKKKLQEDFAQLLKEREQLEERCASYEHEKIQLGPRLEETKWEVCQKSGEISLLKQQLKEVQGELAQRVGEAVSLRGQLRDARGELTSAQVQLQEAHAAARTRTLELEVCENELQRRKSEAELLREKVGRLEGELAPLRDAPANQGPGSRQCQVFQGDGEAARDMKAQMERMRSELASERRRAEEQTGGFQEERKVWQEEKDKVIRYQKQLQQNYVLMYRRNGELERLLQELSLELESRDDDDGSGNEINFDEIAATEI